MGRLTSIASGDSIPEQPKQEPIEVTQSPITAEDTTNYHEKIEEEIAELDLPVTPSEASEKNLLFSRKNYLKQFEEEKPEKELNSGKTIAKNSKTETPLVSERKTKRKTKTPEIPWAPVEYDARPSRGRRKKDN